MARGFLLWRKSYTCRCLISFTEAVISTSSLLFQSGRPFIADEWEVPAVAAAQMRGVRPERMQLEPSAESERHGIMERRSRIVRAVWAACLLLATLNHARILAQHGLSWDYGGVGAASALYWSGLTIVDPLVAILLFIRPTIGIPVTVALITTNVVHNLAVTAMFSGEGDFLTQAMSSWAIVSQIVFMLFVFGTTPTAWRGAR